MFCLCGQARTPRPPVGHSPSFNRRTTGISHTGGGAAKVSQCTHSSEAWNASKPGVLVMGGGVLGEERRGDKGKGRSVLTCLSPSGSQHSNAQYPLLQRANVLIPVPPPDLADVMAMFADVQPRSRWSPAMSPLSRQSSTAHADSLRGSENSRRRHQRDSLRGEIGRDLGLIQRQAASDSARLMAQQAPRAHWIIRSMSYTRSSSGTPRRPSTPPEAIVRTAATAHNTGPSFDARPQSLDYSRARASPPARRHCDSSSVSPSYKQPGRGT
jgi:hypothetical protein